MTILKYNWCKIKYLNLSTVWWILIYVWNPRTYPSSPVSPEITGRHFPEERTLMVSSDSPKGEKNESYEAWLIEIPFIHSTYCQYQNTINNNGYHLRTECDRYYARHFTCIISDPEKNSEMYISSSVYHLHFTDKKTKAQNEVTCPMPHINYTGICKS